MELRLGGRAFDVLVALVERRDRVVEFDELLDIVWPGLAVEENNLSVQVSAIRKLIGSRAITTVRGKGYRFTVPAHEVTPPDADPVVPRSAQTWAGRPGAFVLAVRSAHGNDPSCPSPRLSAGWQSALLAGIEGRVVHQASEWFCVAFERPRDAARSALRILRESRRLGRECGDESRPSVRAGLAATDEDGVYGQQGAALAHALAGAAGPGEVNFAAELSSEFVPGIDGDIEDLGDLHIADRVVRAYRLIEAQRAVSSPSTAEVDDGTLQASVAVLPFEGLFPGDAEGMLGEALADDVITWLARSSEVAVISGLSSRRLRRCGLPPADMAGWLAARFLLLGTYRAVDGRVALDVHLQDARRGVVLHAVNIELSVQEAFGPVESVGYRIARDIREAVFRHALQQAKEKPIPALENYSLLMAAIGLMHRAAVHEFDRARSMLEHLLARQGCAAAAAAWLAKWHVLRVVQGWSVDASVDAQLALGYVERSLQDDSRDALALSIGGLVYAYLRKDLRLAGQYYEDAIDANPSEPLAWLFSATRHAYLGHGAQAQAASDRALQLSPIDPQKYFFDSLAATAALANANWDRSVALSQRSLKANRTHASTWRTLVIALVQSNRVDEARDAAHRLLALEPSLTVGRFIERFPGRDGPLAGPFAEALKVAGVPD